MRRALVTAAVLLLGVAGCTSATPDPGTTSGTSTPPATTSSPTKAGTSSRPGSPTRTSPSGTSAGKAEQVLARMSLRERVGQLIMIDCPSSGVAPATRSAITQDAVGSVILDGTSQAGLGASQSVVNQLRSLAPQQVGLFVATDQEGGLVQRLQGQGFDRIPDGNQQGRLAPATLQADAKRWGNQLRQAGVNVNLAPVLDTVPAGSGPNPPIGDLQRQYGSTPAAVSSHGLAFARGMSAAGVVPVVKHFPGLGRVSGNTDVTAGVSDTVTTADDPYLAPFRDAISAGVPFVMMATASYARIDPGTLAAFSRTVVTGLLRQKLGFRGVVVSDDVGAAAQVSYLTPGQRAVAFVRAGGDLVLTVVGDQAGPMTSALLAEARSDPSFAKLVDAAALRVLRAKQAAGLLR